MDEKQIKRRGFLAVAVGLLAAPFVSANAQQGPEVTWAKQTVRHSGTVHIRGVPMDYAPAWPNSSQLHLEVEPDGS